MARNNISRSAFLVFTVLGLASCERPRERPNYPPPTVAGQEAKDFLCKLSGGPFGVRQSELAGRRYTQEERKEARTLIASALKDIGLRPVEQRYKWTAAARDRVSRFDPDNVDGGGTNLMAELPASVPSDKWVVVGSHYDSVKTSPGADDDGSGVTATLLVARELAKLPNRRTNVIFAFFDQEEANLIGSDAFVRASLKEGRRIIAAHCIDMVGWDGNRNRAFEIGRGATWRPSDNDPFMGLYSRAATRVMTNAKSLALRSGPGYLTHTTLDSSDHTSFLRQGIPAVLVTEEFLGDDRSPNYHEVGDTCDTIDYDHLLTAAALVTEAVKEQLR